MRSSWWKTYISLSLRFASRTCIDISKYIGEYYISYETLLHTPFIHPALSVSTTYIYTNICIIHCSTLIIIYIKPRHSLSILRNNALVYTWHIIVSAIAKESFYWSNSDDDSVLFWIQSSVDFTLFLVKIRTILRKRFCEGKYNDFKYFIFILYFFVAIEYKVN